VFQDHKVIGSGSVISEFSLHIWKRFLLSRSCMWWELNIQSTWDFSISWQWLWRLLVLLIEALSISETSVNFYNTAWPNIQENSHLHSHHNLKHAATEANGHMTSFEGLVLVRFQSWHNCCISPSSWYWLHLPLVVLHCVSWHGYTQHSHPGTYHQML
jgi:hypothetical protein